MKLSLAIPDPLFVEVELFNHAGQGKRKALYCVEPATREQVRRALALDPDSDTLDAMELEAARAGQAAILVERSGLVITEEPLSVDWSQRLPHDALTGEQCGQLCRALMHFHLGQDPVQAEAMHQVKKNAVLLSRLLQLAQSSGSDSTPQPSLSPASSDAPSAPLEKSDT